MCCIVHTSANAQSALPPLSDLFLSLSLSIYIYIQLRFGVPVLEKTLAMNASLNFLKYYPTVKRGMGIKMERLVRGTRQ